MMSAYRKNAIAGFTLLEVIISSAILIAVVIFLGVFIQKILNFGTYFTENFSSQQELQRAFQLFIPEVRALTQSSLGGYPIEEASSTSFTFYSDIDNDGLAERVRYFLSGGIIKKGILKPVGSPLVYNPANEFVSEEIHNIVLSFPAPTSTIFSYFGLNYAGGESAMTFPVTVADIRTVKISVAVKESNQNTPILFEVKLTPRNLRDN